MCQRIEFWWLQSENISGHINCTCLTDGYEIVSWRILFEQNVQLPVLYCPSV